MNKKVVAQFAIHIPTGVKIPIVVNKVDSNNVIQDYKEFLDNRKGFSIAMLQNRWDLCKEDSIELLHRYQVPAHVNHEQVKKLSKDGSPIDVAVFFEEYIYGIEKKEKLIHKKVKPKRLKLLRNH